MHKYTCWHHSALPSSFVFITRSTLLLCLHTRLLLPSPFWPPPEGSQGDVCPQGTAQSTYSELLLLLWLRGSVGRLESRTESRTWMPSELTARIKIVTIASTGSFSRTITLQRLRRAALTWKEGFSVVAPIRVIVPHST